jgi:hypothetical protein
VPPHLIDDLSRLALLIEEREFTHDLVHAGFVDADGDRHVLPAEAVAQRPGLHLAVAPDVSVGNLVVQLARFRHRLDLKLSVDSGASEESAIRPSRPSSLAD